MTGIIDTRKREFLKPRLNDVYVRVTCITAFKKILRACHKSTYNYFWYFKKPLLEFQYAEAILSGMGDECCLEFSKPSFENGKVNVVINFATYQSYLSARPQSKFISSSTALRRLKFTTKK